MASEVVCSWKEVRPCFLVNLSFPVMCTSHHSAYRHKNSFSFQGGIKKMILVLEHWLTRLVKDYEIIYIMTDSLPHMYLLRHRLHICF